MANSLMMVNSKNNQLQNSVGGFLRLWLILELIVYQIGEMVKDRQGNGKLLHYGENGLIAIDFFMIERQYGNGDFSTILNFLADSFGKIRRKILSLSFLTKGNLIT
jgi:hypothetical protein